MKGIIRNTSVAMISLALSAMASAADLSGTWTLEVDTGQGISKPTMTLAQEGSQVTGTYTSDQLGTSDIAGTVDGDQFTLTANMSMQGQDFALEYTGSQNDDAISGNVDLAGMGGGEFTGKRQ